MTAVSKLVVEFVDGRHWLLVEDLSYELPDGQGSIVVPAGFLTDFASIPRPLWSLVGDPGGPWAPAAVVHDYLYRTGLMPRAEADAIFYEAMAAEGIRTTKRWLMWLAVRVGGWAAYRKARGEGKA